MKCMFFCVMIYVSDMQCILHHKYIVANGELRYNTVESDVYSYIGRICPVGTGYKVI